MASLSTDEQHQALNMATMQSISAFGFAAQRCETLFYITFILITDRFKVILLLWFYLFCVLESNFCAV